MCVKHKLTEVYFYGCALKTTRFRKATVCKSQMISLLYRWLIHWRGKNIKYYVTVDLTKITRKYVFEQLCVLAKQVARAVSICILKVERFPFSPSLCFLGFWFVAGYWVSPSLPWERTTRSPAPPPSAVDGSAAGAEMTDSVRAFLRDVATVSKHKDTAPINI